MRADADRLLLRDHAVFQHVLEHLDEIGEFGAFARLRARKREEDLRLGAIDLAVFENALFQPLGGLQLFIV